MTVRDSVQISGDEQQYLLALCLDRLIPKSSAAMGATPTSIGRRQRLIKLSLHNLPALAANIAQFDVPEALWESKIARIIGAKKRFSIETREQQVQQPSASNTKLLKSVAYCITK